MSSMDIDACKINLFALFTYTAICCITIKRPTQNVKIPDKLGIATAV